MLNLTNGPNHLDLGNLSLNQNAIVPQLCPQIFRVGEQNNARILSTETAKLSFAMLPIATSSVAEQPEIESQPDLDALPSVCSRLLCSGDAFRERL
jgi:hypothetical protein